MPEHSPFPLLSVVVGGGGGGGEDGHGNSKTENHNSLRSLH